VVNDSIQRGELDADISFVFCNRVPGESQESDLFLKLVESYHFPLICFSSEKFKLSGEGKFSDQRRLEYDREIMRRLASFRPDLCVLAGYMLITGKEMCQRYTMINLHPAAPEGPRGTWQEVIRQLIKEKATKTGVIMHLVTPELDQGPVISFCCFPIEGGSDLIRQKGVVRELPMVLRTIKMLAEGKIKIANGKVVNSQDQTLENGYDLTEEIDALVKRRYKIWL